MNLDLEDMMFLIRAYIDLSFHAIKTYLPHDSFENCKYIPNAKSKVGSKSLEHFPQLNELDELIYW